MAYRLGINLGFATNRFVEPEEWTRIVREELGLNYVQFVADLLNPFLPDDYIEPQLERIQDSAELYDIQIESVFTSTYTRLNHMMHPDERAREIARLWFKKLLDIGAALGARSAGSHFGILTVKTNENPEERDYIIEEGVKGWQGLSRYAGELGYRELIFEPMSIPREMAYSIKETKELLKRVNYGSAIPVKLCLDIGHAPHPDDRDPYEWIRELAYESPIIHIQQTELHKSHHWPFTKAFNELGIIDAKRVVETAMESGCDDALFALEISHREHWDTDGLVVPDLKESVDYWRQYIEE